MKIHCIPRRLSVTCQEIQSQDSRNCRTSFKTKSVQGHSAIRGNPGRAQWSPGVEERELRVQGGQAAGVCKAGYRELEKGSPGDR